MPILEQRVSEPLRKCNVCGSVKLSSHSINVIITVGSPGHPDMVPFQNEQEWACSPDCYKALAHRIIDEQIYPHLVQLHAIQAEREQSNSDG